jgi:hypothetical protein
MDNDKPTIEKVTEAITKAANTVKHAVEDFTETTNKVGLSPFTPSGFLSDEPMMPLYVMPSPIKRGPLKPGKRLTKKPKQYAAPKLRKPAKKRSKISAKNTSKKKRV